MYLPCLTRREFSLLMAAMLQPPPSLPRYQVGHGSRCKTLADLPPLQPGDVVEMAPGIHNGLFKLRASGTAERPIVLRGAAEGTAVLDGTGHTATGAGAVPRAVLQIEGSWVRIENLAFRNARNLQGNAAGIRVTGAAHTTLFRCSIMHCDMGIMSDSNDMLHIEQCEIAFNGSPQYFNGYSHNLYLGGNRTKIRFCNIHHPVCGMNVKTRGRFTALLYNYIANSQEGELSLVDEQDTGLPYSNALLLGNVVVSSSRRTGNDWKFLDFGQDMGRPHNGTLFLIHNTFAAGSPHIQFLQASSAQAGIEAHNNIFYGSSQIVRKAPGTVSGSHNWLPENTPPSGLTECVFGVRPGFENPAAHNFRLMPGSLCLTGAQPAAWQDETGSYRSGRQRYIFQPPSHFRRLHGPVHFLGALP